MQPRQLLLSTMMVALSAGLASAQTPRTISVHGNAEIKVAPNEVIVTVGVETSAMEIERARSENDSKVKAITQAARGQGVAAEHVRTDFIDIRPRYRDDDIRRDFLGFFARRSLAITLRDVSKFEPLMSAVLAAGANYLHGVDFRTTELRRYRDEARRLALIAAREKATAMAASFNVALGDPVTIQEGSSEWSSPYGSWWGPRYYGMNSAQNSVQVSGGSGLTGDEALVPGQISVTASVNVAFELARPK
jgi:uncharacterized protein